MDFSHTAEDEAFRRELVDWLDENLPEFLAEWADDHSPDRESDDHGGVLSQMERRRAWQRKLNFRAQYS